ncbi:DedA family protein [Streptomyces sp. RB6PN25]|uniref:DedA family protein n=1 Tax=Streptomyces humicola TaxID=2953240 RepID=A0ABT1PQH0_9ACTN|nr:DedA family protein [Streptomyces humicola]MCQ4079923.1 DedA family protein [Streptomyces humicola]
MHINEWLQTIPPLTIYLLVAGVIGTESLGVPLPGEIVLVSAALMASQGHVDPVVVGVCAIAGAVIGDSIGYAIGRKGGKPLFERIGRRFPRHFGPEHLAKAERSFQRWGMWAVFFGRFVALLRIFAGPLAGALRMRYWKFLTANVLGGIAWAGGTTAGVYYIGLVAEAWLRKFSYLALIAAVLLGIASFVVVRCRAGSRPSSGEEPQNLAARAAVEEERAQLPS